METDTSRARSLSFTTVDWCTKVMNFCGNRFNIFIEGITLALVADKISSCPFSSGNRNLLK